MLPVRKTAVVLALIVTAAMQPAASQPAVVPVGRWENRPVTTVGIGQIIEFTSAGQLYTTPGSLVNGRYSGDSVRLVQTASSPPETVTVRIAIRADTMTQYSMDRVDSVRLLRRAPSSHASGIVGAWSSRGPSGQESVVEYRADGSFRLWVPFETDTASFRISADTLFVDGGKLNGTYRFTTVAGGLRLAPIHGAAKPSMLLVKSSR